MKNLRLFIKKKPSLTLALGFILILTSCNVDGVINSSHFTGKDYINGIFFAKGEVAEAIPGLTANFDLNYFVDNEQTRIEVDLMREEIVSSLDEDFLFSFKKAMESKDHFKIQEALQTAGKKIFKTISENPDLNLYQFVNSQNSSIVEVIGKKFDGRDASKEEMKTAIDEALTGSNVIDNPNGGRSNLVNEQQCVAGPAVAAVAAIVGAVIYILFVLNVAAFWTEVGVTWSEEAVETSNNALYKEQLVNSIATTF